MKESDDNYDINNLNNNGNVRLFKSQAEQEMDILKKRLIELSAENSRLINKIDNLKRYLSSDLKKITNRIDKLEKHNKTYKEPKSLSPKKEKTLKQAKIICFNSSIDD